LFLLHGFHI